jgi:DNA polymerase
MTTLHLDYETYSDVDLKVHGLDRYTSDSSTEVLMLGWAFDHDEPSLWLPGDPLPKDVKEALLDPEVEKWAFNAQFERVVTRRLMRIKTPVEGWRCTMALAFMQSFSGDLEQIGKLVGLPPEKQKYADGKKLVKLFTGPQRITKNQPHARFTAETHPELWERFCGYCPQDVAAERAIKGRLIKYPIPASEWALYELDQKINDRGLPVDLEFVRNSYAMSVVRKAELKEEMQEITGLANPNSGTQLLPWVKERGYWFNDLKKDTVKKVLAENVELHDGAALEPECVKLLGRRQQAAKTSPTKLAALQRRAHLKDQVIRFTFQFAGAQRTQRWAGRGFQPHNLVRPSKEVSLLLDMLREAVKNDDYEWLKTLMA